MHVVIKVNIMRLKNNKISHCYQGVIIEMVIGIKQVNK